MHEAVSSITLPGAGVSVVQLFVISLVYPRDDDIAVFICELIDLLPIIILTASCQIYSMYYKMGRRYSKKKLKNHIFYQGGTFLHPYNYDQINRVGSSCGTELFLASVKQSNIDIHRF